MMTTTKVSNVVSLSTLLLLLFYPSSALFASHQRSIAPITPMPRRSIFPLLPPQPPSPSEEVKMNLPTFKISGIQELKKEDEYATCEAFCSVRPKADFTASSTAWENVWDIIRTFNVRRIGSLPDYLRTKSCVETDGTIRRRKRQKGAVRSRAHERVHPLVKSKQWTRQLGYTSSVKGRKGECSKPWEPSKNRTTRVRTKCRAVVRSNWR